MSRRHVVLPEPDGPSIAKDSPASTLRLTRSTARTVPKVRATSRNSTAADISPSEKSRLRRFFPTPASATAHDGHVVRSPPAVRHAHVALSCALRLGRAPEVNLLEVLDAVGLAARGA